MSDKYTEHSPHALAHDEGDYLPNPIPHRPIAGNTADDDGLALDQYFEAMDLGPQTYTGAIPAEPEVKHKTRILTRTLPVQDMATGGQPLQFFPADPNRISMTLYLAGDSATLPVYREQVAIGGAKNNVYGNGFISMSTLVSNPLTIEGYTGEIWVATQTLVEARSLTVICLTK